MWLCVQPIFQDTKAQYHSEVKAKEDENKSQKKRMRMIWSNKNMDMGLWRDASFSMFTTSAARLGLSSTEAWDNEDGVQGAGSECECRWLCSRFSCAFRFFAQKSDRLKHRSIVYAHNMYAYPCHTVYV